MDVNQKLVYECLLQDITFLWDKIRKIQNGEIYPAYPNEQRDIIKQIIALNGYKERIFKLVKLSQI